MHCVPKTSTQRRRKQFESGGRMASAEREPIRGSGGGAPRWVQGQSPWSGGQGAKPPEAERFLGIIRRKDRQYLPLYPTSESAEISPRHCLESKWAYSTQKIHTQCVREREQTELSHSQCIWCTKPHCPQSLLILENSIFSGLGSL